MDVTSRDVQQSQSPTALPLGDTDELREDILLHLLRVGRDCVDVTLVRWALHFQPDEDLGTFLSARKKIATCTAKNGLVRASGETMRAMSTKLEDHPELALLDNVISRVMEVFIQNGNVHVSYWYLEDLLCWNRNDNLVPLRSYFTLPRLLSFFSVFDHNFAKQTCALSPRNFAVFGSEAVVKQACLAQQGGKSADALVSSAGLTKPEGEVVGEFVSVLALMRQLRWQSSFAPHIGDFLEWAWRTPGIELGVRLTSGDFASKDISLETRDLSERAALLALARRLSAQKDLTEHIASCRHAVQWSVYALGSLERFVKKYTAWFALQGEHIQLMKNRQVDCSGEVGSGAACADELVMDSAPLGSLEVAAAAGDEQSDDTDAEGADVDEYLPPAGLHESLPLRECQPARAGARLRPPRLFVVQDGLPYHRICLQMSEQAPLPKTHPALALPSIRSFSVGLLQDLGAEIERFGRRHCLDADDWAKRCQVRHIVSTCLRGNEPLSVEFPFLDVKIIGTTGSGLGRKESDLDLLLELDGAGNQEVDRTRIPHLLGIVEVALRSVAGINVLSSVPQARIPLLRGQLAQIQFDLSIGTMCGVWNTALLRSCAARNPSQYLPFCAALVSWSKAQGINDSPNGLLSTYSLLLIVVVFLQFKCRLPHELGLSEIAKTGLTVEGPPVLLDEEGCAAESASRHAELGELLVEFFAFAAGFRWDAWILSPRCGGALPRSERARAWRVQPLCIEDPFETHLNTCRRINPRAGRKILAAFEHALRTLLSGRGWSPLVERGGGGKPAEQQQKTSRVNLPS